MATDNKRINKQLEEMESKFTHRFNHIESQVSELQKQQIELTKAITILSWVTVDLANRQPKFETYNLAFNEQLLKQQIVTTKKSIENQKLRLNQNEHQTHKNDTINRNQTQSGIIQNTGLYKIVKQREQNLTLWQQKHPLIFRNQSIRLEQFNRMKEVQKK